MAHQTIEYSANLTDDVDIAAVVDTLHAAALATGVVRVDALRTRAVARRHYAIGDGDADNIFVSVVIRLGPGRPASEKHELLDAVLTSLEEVLGDAAERSMLSVECQEIEAEFRVNRNHLRPMIAERAAHASEN